MLVNCFIALAHPDLNTFYEFYNGGMGTVDYGACCFVTPFLNFVNPKTVKLRNNEYSMDDWLNIPKGAKNGESGGLSFLLDIEQFDYLFTGRESAGVKVAFTDPRDKAIMKQDGYLISPGKYSFLNIWIPYHDKYC